MLEHFLIRFGSLKDTPESAVNLASNKHSSKPRKRSLGELGGPSVGPRSHQRAASRLAARVQWAFCLQKGAAARYTSQSPALSNHAGKTLGW